MEVSTKQIINQNLETIEKKLLMIALSDPEKYAEFSSRLTKLQETFIGLSELDLERQKASLVGAISILEDDFSSYMEGYDQNDIASLVANGKIESGRGKLRAYRFNLYSSIFDDFKKLDYIKLEQLTQLKEQWNIDKVSSDYQFSPVEISAMEQKLSDAFLEYQLKSLKVNGVLPQEKVTDFISLDEYQASIQRRISSSLESKDISPMDKFELDSLRSNPDLRTLLKSPVLFQALAGKKHSITPNEINAILGEPKQEKSISESKDQVPTSSTPKENTALVPVGNPKTKPNYMTCVVELPNKIFNRGKTHTKTIKVKLDSENPKQILIPLKYKEQIISVALPEGLHSLPESVFKGCKKLKEISLPDTLQLIGKDAFSDLHCLEKINLPKSLKSIGKFAFSSCHSLKEINLPESLESIDDYAFYECYNLKEVKLPSKLSHLGEGVFENCSRLEKFDCSENLEVIPPCLLRGCEKLKEINFSKNLVKIGRSALERCRDLVTLTNLPGTLERIEDSAFHNCNRLNIIEFPESLRYLGSGAISALAYLKKLKLPGVMDFIGQAALMNNPNLTEVIMPHTLKEGADIFYKDFRDDLKVIIPENPQGDFYKKMGIKDSTKLSVNDFRTKYFEISEKNKQHTVNISKNSNQEEISL